MSVADSRSRAATGSAKLVASQDQLDTKRSRPSAALRALVTVTVSGRSSQASGAGRSQRASATASERSGNVPT